MLTPWFFVGLRVVAGVTSFSEDARTGRLSGCVHAKEVMKIPFTVVKLGWALGIEGSGMAWPWIMQQWVPLR